MNNGKVNRLSLRTRRVSHIGLLISSVVAQAWLDPTLSSPQPPHAGSHLSAEVAEVSLRRAELAAQAQGVAADRLVLRDETDRIGRQRGQLEHDVALLRGGLEFEVSFGRGRALILGFLFSRRGYVG